MKTNLLNSQNGQLVVEAVLLLVVAMGIIMASTKLLRDNNFLAKIVNEPWMLVSGMAESGVWLDAQQARNKHPNNFKRVRTLDPQ